MRYGVRAYVFRKLLAHIAADAAVFFHRIFVDVDFPADTAAVTAIGGNAIKGLVIIGESV